MDNKDFLYVLPSAGVSLFSCMTKSINTPILESRNSIIKSYSEGLYHITTDEAADAIIASQEVHASGKFTSYGEEKCFFFSGVPDFDNICVNCTPGKTLTAVRVHLPYERLAEFSERSMNDGAITYRGDLSLEGARVEKVRLGLKENGGELCYTPITEEEYQNYELNLSEEKMKIVQNSLAFKLRSLVTGMRRDFELVMKAFKDEHGGTKMFMSEKKYREMLMEENKDLFVHTDEIPVEEIQESLERTEEIPQLNSSQIIEEKNDHALAINLYNQLVNPNQGTYMVGNVISSDANDIKTELLKGVVSSVIDDINKGVTPNMNAPSSIAPGMTDKQIKDCLYANICNGNISGCYELLNNSSVLFSVCSTYIKSNQESKVVYPRKDFFNNELDNYNSGLKTYNYGEMGM